MQDAAVAHLGARNVEAALKEYKAGGAWRMALALAGVPICPTPFCRSQKIGLVTFCSCSCRPAGLVRSAYEAAGGGDGGGPGCGW